MTRLPSNKRVKLAARSLRGRIAFVRPYSADRDEPRHVHVERAEARAKFWLDPIRLAESVGFGRSELADIEKLVVQQAVHVRKAWDDFFTD